MIKAFDGQFFSPSVDGQGFNLNQLNDGRVVGQWFTYGPAGGWPTWFELQGLLNEDGDCEFVVNYYTGGFFSEASADGQIAMTPAGTLMMYLDDDAQVSSFEFDGAFGESGGYDLQALLPTEEEVVVEDPPVVDPSNPIDPPLVDEPPMTNVLMLENVGAGITRTMTAPFTGERVIHRNVPEGSYRETLMAFRIYAGDEDLRITDVVVSGMANPQIKGVKPGDVIPAGGSAPVTFFAAPSVERVYPGYYINSDRGVLVNLDIRWSNPAE